MPEFKVSRIEIIPVSPRDGLVCFCSIVINDCFYVGNISLHTSPNHPGGLRAQFPTKKLANGKHVSCFHPIHREAEEVVTRAIVEKYVELMDNFHHVERVG